VLMTYVYIGSVVDPVAHLRGLPVSVVNEDTGAQVGGSRLDFGALVQKGLARSPRVSMQLSLKAQDRSAATSRMDRGGAYATLVIPRGFTASLLALTGSRAAAGASAGKPTIELLTNRRAGPVGVQLATEVLQPAVGVASRRIGTRLVAAVRSARSASAAPEPVLADPLSFVATEYRPLPAHSALGMSAFYIALLTTMCGLIGATIANTTVDVALGYATTDMGPHWRQRQPLPVSRWQTLMTKWGMALVLTALLTGLMLIVAVAVLRMDAPHTSELWLYSWLGAAFVAAGTLAIFAGLGSQGQLLALLLFVYLGLASAGGTVPLQALPGALKLIGHVEPLRQIVAGDRSILYFGAAGSAGLTRGAITAAMGLLFWLAIGTLVVRWYDGKGLQRMHPDARGAHPGPASALSVVSDGAK
jgi:YhgE/Pip-like protein